MYQGGCLCGNVSFAIKANLKQAIYCHCQFCRKSHGSPYISVLVVLPNNFTVLSGESELKRYPEDESRTGRFVCNNCGSHLYTEAKKGLPLSVNTAALDDEAQVEAMAHTNLESKSPIVSIFDSLPQFNTSLTQADYMALIS